ncbi:glycogen/starch/alpha-glucan phosphorylase [Petroclostridium sp. X23]|uniref:glycogen/starch/alpha-glucan phosphorylase n=1 Tax=Petroclostridium sp. X23 TaxID=3045146 RepID=UPI0024ACC38E|nr:glycogen/starch/alpha-glucan phosphorylase [Petroclostridium sp. X23]WHH61483.1 glycogen/starch/alpha-glucan phosphorylase [Petroclostridium sp. X23]
MFKNKETFKEAFIEKLATVHGTTLDLATDMEKYTALGNLIRDYITQKWIETNNQYMKNNQKEMYYFSLEFLLGKLLGSNLLNLGIADACKEVLQELDIDLDMIENMESDAGLGNGGLGRLAACFLDSLASLQLPGHGCGIRYKYGLFEQKIVDGYQVELPDNWLKFGNVWEIRKPDKAVEVKFGGNIRTEISDGDMVFIHENYDSVLAVPYDTPIVGYENNTVNTLRLWSAEPSTKDFDFSSFSRGDYMKAVEYKYSVEAISQVLYPDDSNFENKILRLKQQYFFVSAGLQSIIRRYKKKHKNFFSFADRIGIHINDTHPVLAIPELMRILMDEEGLGWDEAWRITTSTISYTNHTIMSEALEKWPVDAFKSLLPRIFMIINEINERFCKEAWNRYAGDWDRIHHMAIIADGYVKMAHLAIVGSYSINGVAKLHTKILRKEVMKDFYEFFPYKFNNKTNGITHRRWLLKANPSLASLITDTIGPSWVQHPHDLIKLTRYADDASVLEKLYKIKMENKQLLSSLIKNKYDITLDTASIFDVQVKRIHAYKRQLLNVFHIMDLYNRLRENPDLDIAPRTFIFGGKAAPGYYIAKLSIKLINTLASIINNDKTIKDKIKVVFLENYNVSLAEKIFPASDVSEQISTASKEASGTGNMKFMMNGAITIGTMDGANIEITEEVGNENIFILGLTSDEVLNFYRYGGYNAWDIYNSDARVKMILNQMINGFLPDEKEQFRNIFNYLLYNNDEYFVLKDFASYVDTQNRLEQKFKNKNKWYKMSANNIAHSGKFSSDGTIHEYAVGIWKIDPTHISE